MWGGCCGHLRSKVGVPKGRWVFPKYQSGFPRKNVGVPEKKMWVSPKYAEI